MAVIGILISDVWAIAASKLVILGIEMV